MSRLELHMDGDRQVVVTRRFSATPQRIYEAHVDASLLREWLLGPEGWSMTVCISDAEPGGKIRHEWVDGNGGGFSITGEYAELEPFRRIVHVERMHLPEATPDNLVETTFSALGAGTLMTKRMTLPDADARAAMLASGMEHGMEASYQQLDRVSETADA